MPIPVNQDFKNLKQGLEIPDQDLVIFAGANNSGKSALLQYLNIYGPFKDTCDYISPARFNLSNEVTIAINQSKQLRRMFEERKHHREELAEFTAPDAIQELISLPNDKRQLIINWHNRYFGELKVESSNPQNRFAPPRITIDGRLATQQGSGSRAVLAVLCALLHPDRQAVLIDEPEIGTEPQVQKRLAQLIKKVATAAQSDNLPKKRVYVATHSSLFLDRDDLENNWVVSQNHDGNASLRQVKTAEEMHSIIYHLLGNSPEDLFFPDNVLVVEGPSDQLFWSRLLELSGAGGIAVHYSDGDSNVSAAINAIDQMLRTLAYIPWYREHLCIAVDAGVPQARIDEWKNFLQDNDNRVRRLSANGIEHFYPASIMSSITGLTAAEAGPLLEQFLRQIRHGARAAKLGNFEGSKRELAKRVREELTTNHVSELAEEIREVLDIVKQHRFSHSRNAE